MADRRTAVTALLGFLVFTLLAAFPSTAMAQVRPGGIAGIVLDEKGAPVANAAVILRHADNELRRARTDDRGRFEFRALRPGEYAVIAEKREVGRDRAPAPVRSEQVTRVRLVLHR